MTQNHKLSLNWWYISWCLSQNLKKNTRTNNCNDYKLFDKTFLNELFIYELYLSNRATISIDTDVFSIASAKPGKFVPLMWRARLRSTLRSSNRKWRCRRTGAAGPMGGCRSVSAGSVLPFKVEQQRGIKQCVLSGSSTWFILRD